MKQRIAIVLVVLSLLTALVGIAAAPKAPGTVQLVGVQYVPGKGPVFTFEVSGKVSKGELHGTVQVDGGRSFPLYCTQVNDTTVKCSGPDKVSGVNVSVTWGGSTFWTFVPEELVVETAATAQYCYSIWDFWWFTDMEWTDFGPYCQGTPAQAGDSITYTVPDPEEVFESDPVFFYDEDVTDYCPSPVPYNGPAYYIEDCPENYY